MVGRVTASQMAGEQAGAPAHHDEFAANFADGRAIVLAEIGDGFEIRSQAARQPHRLDIALAFPLAIRPIALNRKNSLFAGHDQGAENWACVATLLETCKLNSVNPLAWLADVLTKLVNRWPAKRIYELMPWAYASTATL